MKPRSKVDPSHARMLTMVSALSLLAVLSLMFTRPSVAQEASLNAPATSGDEKDPFRGNERCNSCHRTATPEQVTKGVPDFVSMNESIVWGLDIHSQAFKLIDPATSPLGKQICDKLGIKDIHESRECLSCHSDWRPGQASKPSTYTSGVACESCHGQSRKWDGEHSEEFWRAKPVTDKEALDMIDVRNPIKRAEQCFGCHIGNAAEGKVITHAMYAAGHPPLPSIEIESFAQQMPRHWRYLDEKIADAKSKQPGNEATEPFKRYDEFLRENHRYLNLPEEGWKKSIHGHNHRAAAVVLGGVVALRESIELMGDSCSGEPLQRRGGPELATYDCRACHHDLEVPSGRQQQRNGSIPGRPMISSWPATLMRLAIRHVTEDRPSYDKKLAEFHTRLAVLQSELQRTPFGSPSAVHDACDELSKWLTDEVVTPVSAKPFDDDAVADAITVLLVIGSTEQHDYDSARQIAWALRVLTCDGSAGDTRGKAINEFLTTLAPQLRLDLLNGTGDSCAPVSKSVKTRELTPLAVVLSASLSASYKYDPALFRKQMQQLREQLPGKTKSTK